MEAPEFSREHARSIRPTGGARDYGARAVLNIWRLY